MQEIAERLQRIEETLNTRMQRIEETLEGWAKTLSAASKKEQNMLRRKQYREAKKRAQEGLLPLPERNVLNYRDKRIKPKVHGWAEAGIRFGRADQPEQFFTWLVHQWNNCTYLKKPITFSGSSFRIWGGHHRYAYGARDLMGYVERRNALQILRNKAEHDDFTKRPWWDWTTHAVFSPVFHEMLQMEFEDLPERFRRCCRIMVGGFGSYEVYTDLYWDFHEEQANINRMLKRMGRSVGEINAFEQAMSALGDDQLAAKTEEFRQRAVAGETPEALMAEVFAVVRETAKRVLDMRHFDVQLVGGMVLYDGKIAEMRTGEGKTLVATLPAYLTAVYGQTVHVVTVNDYLAARDAEWMGRLYRFLGLSTGVVIPNQGSEAKKAAYQADITYGQNNEFGFDYLRDNMKFALSDYAQRGHAFCIVDEVDSILIDEARTPLIISGPTEDRSEGYRRVAKLVPTLGKDEHYVVDEKGRTVLLTEAGVERCENIFEVENLYDPVNIDLLHHISQALRGQTMFKRDRDYVVENGEVVIVDEHTGRLMHGRRWSDGLHQAIEAKENVRIQKENQTLATVTFQNYFRLLLKCLFAL